MPPLKGSNSRRGSNLLLTGNTFRGNTVCGINLDGDVTALAVMRGNTVETGNALGILAGPFSLVDDNTVSGAGSGTGLKIMGSGVSVTGNRFNSLLAGVLLDEVTPYNTTIKGNTFTGNRAGVKLEMQAGSYATEVPTISCNTFTAPNISNSKGIHFGPDVRMFDPSVPGGQNVMGSMGIGTNTKPFGNYFAGITEPLRNDNAANRLQYYVYDQSQEDIPMSTVLLGVDLLPTGFDASAAPCHNLPYGTGVLTRQGNGRIAIANTEQLTGLGLAYPNPAQVQATVSYYLPSGTRAAAVLVREVMTGKPVRSYDLPVQPEGSLQIDLKGFRNGLYTYTLLVDGKPKDTRILRVEK